MLGKSLVVAASVLAGIFVMAGGAHAGPCFDNCTPSVRLFSAAQEIPGNLIYFAHNNTGPDVSLETASGVPVAASQQLIGASFMFAPDMPVAAGTSLRLRFESTCFTGSGEVERRPGVFEFRSGAAKQLVISPLALVIAEQAVVRDGPTSGVRYGMTRVEFALPSEPHLVDLDVRLDGIPISADAPGTDARRASVTLYARCDDAQDRRDSCEVLREVGLGRHKLDVDARVVGAPKGVVPASIEVTTSCDVPERDAGAQTTKVDAGDVTQPDRGVMAQTRDSAVARVEDAAVTAADAMVAERAEDSDAGGCDLHHGAAPGALTGWFSAIAALAARRLGTRASRK